MDEIDERVQEKLGDFLTNSKQENGCLWFQVGNKKKWFVA